VCRHVSETQDDAFDFICTIVVAVTERKNDAFCHRKQTKDRVIEIPVEVVVERVVEQPVDNRAGDGTCVCYVEVIREVPTEKVHAYSHAPLRAYLHAQTRASEGQCHTVVLEVACVNGCRYKADTPS
jgi:hypothetical protein